MNECVGLCMIVWTDWPSEVRGVHGAWNRRTLSHWMMIGWQILRDEKDNVRTNQVIELKWWSRLVFHISTLFCTISLILKVPKWDKRNIILTSVAVLHAPLELNADLNAELCQTSGKLERLKQTWRPEGMEHQHHESTCSQRATNGW